MKIKKGTDLEKYGFVEQYQGMWVLELPITEITSEYKGDVSLVCENGNLYISIEIENNQSDAYFINVIADLPISNMIKDGVVEWKH